MRRRFAPERAAFCLALAALLCLVLAACRGAAEPAPQPEQPAPAAPEAPPEPVAPLRLDELNVEFVVDGARLTDEGVNALLAMQKELPAALTAALAAQSVEVGGVNVTFGPSGEATETALRNGAVQLAFLPAEDYYPYRSGMIVAVEQGETPALTLSLIVAAVSDDAAADERFARSLREALPELADVLAPYTAAAAQGRYDYDSERIEQLAKLYEAENEAA